MRKFTLTAVMGACLSLLASGEAKAANFTFTRIADTSPFSLISGPSINDSGTVAFSAANESFVDNPFPATLISGSVFTGDGDRLTTIFRYDPSPFAPPRDFANNVVINNTGTVAFEIITGFPRGNATIFFARAGRVSAIAEFESEGIPGLALNDNEAVAFRTLNFPVFESIRVINNGQESTLAAYLLDSFSDPSINNAGTVVFSGVNPNSIGGDRPLEIGIFTASSSGGEILTPLVIESSTFGSFTSPFINDLGIVAFAAEQSPTGAGVFTINSNRLLTRIADTSGLFNSFSNVSINEEGTVAFAASLDTGGEGIFLGSDPVNDKVITTGDSILGSTVTDLGFISAGLNNQGQIAFFARLANGNTGIFRAEPHTPEPVPESTSTLGLLAFGALGAGSMLKRQQKKQIKPAS